MFGYSKMTEVFDAFFSQCYFILNNWLPAGWKICKDLELKLYSQTEESFMSCLKWLFVFAGGMFLNILKNLSNKFKGSTKWSDKKL